MEDEGIIAKGDAISVSDQSLFNRNYCKYCGEQLQNGAAYCSSCGKPQNKMSVHEPQERSHALSTIENDDRYQNSMGSRGNNQSNSTTVVVHESRSNGLGTAGFVFAILSLLLCWVPVVDVVIWLLGALFSFFGLFKSPRGLAIVGFLLSFIDIIILVSVFGALVSIFGSLFR